MNKIFIKLFFLMFLPVTTNCFCQDKDNTRLTDITKATFFNPGISYEKSIAKFQSLYGQLFMNTSFAIGFSSEFGTTSYIHFDPAATLQYRYYYNSEKREAKGKRIQMNSLNYLASIVEVTFSKGSISSSYVTEKDRRAINVAGIAWGFQRNYPKRFSLDINLGAGFLFTRVTTINDSGELTIKNEGQFTTIGQVNLGFWLNKKN